MKKDQNSLPAAKSDKDLAEFFLNNIEKIRQQFETFTNLPHQ